MRLQSWKRQWTMLSAIPVSLSMARALQCVMALGLRARVLVSIRPPSHPRPYGGCLTAARCHSASHRRILDPIGDEALAPLAITWGSAPGRVATIGYLLRSGYPKPKQKLYYEHYLLLLRPACRCKKSDWKPGTSWRAPCKASPASPRFRDESWLSNCSTCFRSCCSSA